MFGSIKKLTDLDPTGLSGKAVDTATTVTEVAVGGVGMATGVAASAMTDPIGTISDAGSYGTNLLTGIVSGFKISIGDMDVELDTEEAVAMLYDALVPQCAQAVLAGRLPSKDDFQNDAIAFVGGPVEGIYVASNSPSAALIAKGHTPPAEMLGADMISALTPVAKRRMGL